MKMTVLTYWWCEKCEAVLTVNSCNQPMEIVCPACRNQTTPTTNLKEAHRHLILVINKEETYQGKMQ